MSKFLSVLVVVLLFAFSASAGEPKHDGFFLGIEGGGSFSNDSGVGSINEETREGYPNFQWDLNDSLGQGFNAGAFGGWSFGNVGGGRLRLGGLVGGHFGLGYEPSFGYAADMSYGEGRSKSLTANGGYRNSIHSVSGRAIVEYDLVQFGYKGESTDAIRAVYPTLGGGVGFAQNSITNQRFSASLNKTYTRGESSDSHKLGVNCAAQDKDYFDLAWHAQAGVGVDMAEGWSAQVLYRYTDLGAVQTGEDWSCTASSDKGSKDFKADLRGEDVDMTFHEVIGRIVKRF